MGDTQAQGGGEEEEEGHTGQSSERSHGKDIDIGVGILALSMTPEYIKKRA